MRLVIALTVRTVIALTVYGSDLEEENADWRAEQYQGHSRDCYDQVTEEVSLPKHFQLW